MNMKAKCCEIKLLSIDIKDDHDSHANKIVMTKKKQIINKQKKF